MKKTNELWSNYWQQGHKTSFGNRYTEEYEGTISIFWKDVFSKLSDSNHILDLCTGNASLIYVAQKGCTNFEGNVWHGVDYAKINVSKELVELSNVKLIEQTSIEDLGLTHKYYDLVISNFGIEYSQIDRAIEQVAEVIKDNGKLKLVCHNKDSILIKESTRELKIVSCLLKKHGVMQSLHSMLLHMDHGKHLAEKYRKALNNSISNLLDRFGDSVSSHDYFKFLKYVMNDKKIDKTLEFEKYNQELICYQARLECMVEASIDKQGLATFAEILLKNNFSDIVMNEVFDNERLVAHSIHATKGGNHHVMK